MLRHLFEDLKDAVKQDLTAEQRSELLQVVRESMYEHMSETIIARGTQMVDETRQCRHCGHANVFKHGFDALGRQRFRCVKTQSGGCGRTFNGLTGTVLSRMRCPEKWAAYAECMKQHWSLRATASVVGVNYRTAFRWRHCLLSVQSVIQSRTLGGVVEADETFFRDSFKGSRGWKRGNPPAPRMPRYRGGARSTGLSFEYVPVLTALDRSGAVFEQVLNRRGEIAIALDGRIEPGSVLCSDGLAVYRRVAEESDCEHRRIFLPRKDWLDRAMGDEPRQEGKLTLGRVNHHHRTLKSVLNRCANGVSTGFLANYLGWLRAIRRKTSDAFTLLSDTLIYRTLPA